MSRKHNEVSYIDLLVTLDYLLNKTNKEHPTFTVDMCRYARDEYDLSYSEDTKVGNQVKHTRFAACLSFLWDAYNEYPGAFPFILKKTPKGRYYIEDKYHLDEEQKIKLLSAVKNDKDISNKETNIIIDNLLFLLTNQYDVDYYKSKIVTRDKSVRKPTAKEKKKIKQLQQALEEEKLVILNRQIYRDGKMTNKSLYCRVYQLKEYKNQLYAILIPVADKVLICDYVGNLDIVEDELYEDDPRDLEKELFDRNEAFSYFYKDLDELIDSLIAADRAERLKGEE